MVTRLFGAKDNPAWAQAARDWELQEARAIATTLTEEYGGKKALCCYEDVVRRTLEILTDSRSSQPYVHEQPIPNHSLGPRVESGLHCLVGIWATHLALAYNLGREFAEGTEDIALHYLDHLVTDTASNRVATWRRDLMIRSEVHQETTIAYLVAGAIAGASQSPAAFALGVLASAGHAKRAYSGFLQNARSLRRDLTSLRNIF